MRKLMHGEILDQRLAVDEALQVTRHPVIGVLEDIRSLYNVGSCFRTADAMLLDRLILTGYTPSPPRREIDKTALGATGTVPWRYVHDPIEAIADLRDDGITVLALEITDRSVPLDALDALDEIRYPVAIVAGNEIGGVSQRTLDVCHGAIEIPMFGVKHSLNVAVAFGIAIWEVVRRMRAERV